MSPVRSHFPSGENVSLVAFGFLQYPFIMLGPWTQSSPVWEGPRDVISLSGSVVDMSFAEVLAFGSPTPKESLRSSGFQPRREQVTLFVIW